MKTRTIVNFKITYKKHTRSEPASQEYPECLACQEQSCAPSRGLHKKHRHLLPVAPAVIPLAIQLQIFDMPFFWEDNKLQESVFYELLLSFLFWWQTRGQYLVNWVHSCHCHPSTLVDKLTSCFQPIFCDRDFHLEIKHAHSEGGSHNGSQTGLEK